MNTVPPPAQPRLASTSALHIVGFLLRRRLFSAPLPSWTSDRVEAGQKTFLLADPRLPPELQQFQEVLDIALSSLPQVDWVRFARGAARMELLVKQVRVPGHLRAADREREPEPRAVEEVFMNLPHHDVYYPGADYFAVSDAPWSTLFYPQGLESTPARFPPNAVVRYDAVSLHSAPGFCAAGKGEGRPRDFVLRTFVRLLAWDPMWSIRRFPHFAPLLRAPPAAAWERHEVCEAEDVIHLCFDALHTCERCCDLRRGPLGDNACWAGWMSYESCCGPASRRWGGCGWRQGADMWAHDYTLQPLQLHSPAQCQQRCHEEPECGGWTYFPNSWEPVHCRLPLAAIIWLRRVCLLRANAFAPPTPHRGLVWGTRTCNSSGHACLDVGIDQLGEDVALHRDVPDARACRALCHGRDSCRAFAYFPDTYQGDASDECLLPAALASAWKSRCVLKTALVPHGKPQSIYLGNTISGTRTCPPAAPWLQHTFHGNGTATQPTTEGGGGQDAARAVDGNYELSECATQSPWRADFDAEYIVSLVTLWLGDRSTVFSRKLRRYNVALIVAGTDEHSEEEISCGSVLEPLDGGPASLECVPTARAAHSLAISVEDVRGGFALCEVEVRLGPVPCDQLVSEVITIHKREVRIFPVGAASPAPAAARGEACTRSGGSLLALAARGGAAVCVEAACAPTACLEAYDASPEAFLRGTGRGLWDPRIESAAQECALAGSEGGRLYEATVLLHPGSRAEGEASAVASHASFCVPRACDDDGAATVVVRQAGTQGLSPGSLAPATELELRLVRPLARWEDVRLDFLIAGFARSGTHSLLGNLAKHPEVRTAARELTFNWGYIPLGGQVQEVSTSFHDNDGSLQGVGRPLLGGKGEGVALSPRILRLLSAVPGIRLIIIVREPVEWLESIYNLRALGCRQTGHCRAVPSLEDVILRGASFEDVDVEHSALSDAVEVAVRHFPPSSGRLLLLEFEVLRSRPRELFDRLCRFLGIAAFPSNFSFERLGSEERARSQARGERASLCSPELRGALAALRERLARRGEHARLARLLAAAGAPWVSGRLVLNRTHCDA